MQTSGVDAAEIESYLRARTGNAYVVSEAKRAFPGVSRETWLVRGHATGQPNGFVIRIEHPWPVPTPMTLTTEFDLQQALWNAGVPVARPLWISEKEQFAGGRAHMVRELVEGSAEVAGLHAPGPRGDDLRQAVVLSHLSGLAKLHTVDWRAGGIDDLLPAPAHPADALLCEFDRWAAVWTSLRPVRRPVVSEFLAWLRPQVPRDVPQVCLTKGNNGIGEEVFVGHRLVALSDFELAGLTDPALDLAFSQGTLALTDTEGALAHYERESGIQISPERLTYARIWNRFKALACLDLYFLAPALDGRDPRASSAAFGLVTLPRLERGLGRLIGSDLHELTSRGLADAGAGTYH